MRDWMCDPKILCQKHLSGVHVELHMMAGAFRKKKNITGHIRGNQIEPKSVRDRHDAVAEELLRRARQRGEVKPLHKSPLPDFDISYLPVEEQDYKIDRDKALQLLLSRCTECRRSWDYER